MKVRQVALPERLSAPRGALHPASGRAPCWRVPVHRGGPARAERPTIRTQLLARAFANLYADDYIQTLELVAGERAARARSSRTLQILRKQSVRPGKALVRFLEPPDVRRTSDPDPRERRRRTTTCGSTCRRCA